MQICLTLILLGWVCWTATCLITCKEKFDVKGIDNNKRIILI